MDAARVEAYLRSACSTLGFDLGEIWSIQKDEGCKTSLKFVQLYTSPTFEEFRGLLFPPCASDKNCNEAAVHQFSPLICNAVSDGGDLIWANTRSLDGLIGRSEIPLNTAVGMPLFSIGFDLYVMVLFSVQPITLVPDAIDFLRSIAEATSGVLEGFVPASVGMSLTPANVAPFTGMWRKEELMSRFLDRVDFQAISLKNPLYGAGLNTSVAANYTSSDCYLSLFNSAPLPSPKIDAKLSYRQYQTRFHEFMVAALGVTVFDAAELWLLSDRMPELYIVAALHKDGMMQAWTDVSKDLRLGPGVDVPGTVLATGETLWDSNYGHSAFSTGAGEEAAARPPSSRLEIAGRLGIRSAVGVPLLSPKGVTGVLALYSKHELKSDHSIASVLEMSVKLMSLVADESDALSSFDIENTTGMCSQTQLLDWFIEGGLDDWETELASANSAVPMSESFDAPLADCYIGLPLDTADYDVDMGGYGASSEGMFGGLGITANQVNEASHYDQAQNVSSQGVAFSFADGSAKRKSDCLGYYPAPEPSPNAFGELSSASQPLQYKYSAPTAGLTTCGPFSFDILASPSLAPSTLATTAPPTLVSDPSGESHFSAAVEDFLRPSKVARFALSVSDVQSSVPMVSALPSSNTWSGGFVASSTSAPAQLMGSPAGVAQAVKSAVSFHSAASPTKDKDRPAAKRELKICRVDDCCSPCSSRSAFCANHAGMRRCQHEGCSKCAQGSTIFCIAHGGGRRCTVAGCSKGARDKFFCAGHGGGKRCSVSGCSKSAVGGSDHCTGHGGGKRCQEPGCNKSSQSSTNWCVRHGGGRKCSVHSCTKVARGKTDFCASHGGGVRCRMDNCNRTAIARYQLCRPHYAVSAGPGGDSPSRESDGDGDEDEEYEVNPHFVAPASSSPLMATPPAMFCQQISVP